MAVAMNKVITGDFMECPVVITKRNKVNKFLEIKHRYNLCKENVNKYQLIEEESSTDTLFCGISENSVQPKIHTIEIEFINRTNDGCFKSTIEIDDELYKVFITSMFR